VVHIVRTAIALARRCTRGGATTTTDLLPYVLSKIVVLGGLCAIQAFILLWIVGTKSGYPA
jgi:hypothetical protein